MLIIKVSKLYLFLFRIFIFIIFVAKNLSISSNNQSTKVRRALGDVRNTKQNNKQNSSIVNQTPVNYKKLNLEVEKKADFVGYDDEIEMGGFTFVDNFSDIMNDDQKLSKIIKSAVKIPMLPSGEPCDIRLFEDKFYTGHVSDKQMKKHAKKEGIIN